MKLSFHVNEYAIKQEETVILNSPYREFIDILNPFVKHEVLYALYYDQLRDYWLLDGSSQDEIMFIADQMRPELCIAGEIVIFQGDVGEKAYIITEGKVQIIIKRTSTSDIKDDLNNEV